MASSSVQPKPPWLSYQEARAICGGSEVLDHLIDSGRVRLRQDSGDVFCREDIMAWRTISLNELSKATGVSKSRLRTLADRGTLPYLVVRKRRRILRSALDQIESLLPLSHKTPTAQPARRLGIPSSRLQRSTSESLVTQTDDARVSESWVGFPAARALAVRDHRRRNVAQREWVKPATAQKNMRLDAGELAWLCDNGHLVCDDESRVSRASIAELLGEPPEHGRAWLMIKLACSSAAVDELVDAGLIPRDALASRSAAIVADIRIDATELSELVRETNPPTPDTVSLRGAARILGVDIRPWVQRGWLRQRAQRLVRADVERLAVPRPEKGYVWKPWAIETLDISPFELDGLIAVGEIDTDRHGNPSVVSITRMYPDDE
jgi:excisionase family DNA binding protein